MPAAVVAVVVAALAVHMHCPYAQPRASVLISWGPYCVFALHPPALCQLDQAAVSAQHEAALNLAKTSAAVRVAELQQESERLRALVQATQGSGNAALSVAQQAAESAIKVGYLSAS